MSGAQWSPERLRELSETLRQAPGMADLYEGDVDEAAGALRAFAKVVSVLARNPDEGEWLTLFRDGDHACVHWSLDSGASVFYDGADGLAAILALADALDAGRGDADDA